jgi:hypothetical protein
MHTFVGKTCRIHYNPDLSGDVIITKGKDSIEVAGEDLREFIEQIQEMERKWQE